MTKMLQNQALSSLLTSHSSDAMICSEKFCFYCTFTHHHGTHFRYQIMEIGEFIFQVLVIVSVNIFKPRFLSF